MPVNPIQPMQQPPKIPPGAKLTGAIAAAALLVATPFIMTKEGKKNVTYLDVAKIPTDCYGHTGSDVGKVGTFHTDGECRTLLEKDIVGHMEGAVRCVPGLADPKRFNQLAMSTSLTFNIGVRGFCRSTAARLFNQGRWADGCQAFRRWNQARINGRLQLVKGLDNRRRDEVKICLRGL